MPTASDTADLVPLALIQSTCAEGLYHNAAVTLDSNGDLGRRFRD